MVAKKKKSRLQNAESDSAYFLKIVLYMMVSAAWIRVTTQSGAEYPIPFGAIVALFFVSHEHFRLDRKIEYAIILASMFISFWLPIGLYINL